MNAKKIVSMVSAAMLLFPSISFIGEYGSGLHANDPVITAFAVDEQPVMSPEEAELFVGFIKNKSDLKQEDIHKMEIYQILTGTYAGNNLKEEILETTSAIRYTATFRSNNAARNIDYLSGELITYLESSYGGDDAKLGESLIDDVLEGDTALSYSNAKSIVAKGISEKIDTYFLNSTTSTLSAYDIWSSYASVSKQWNDIKEFYEKVTAGFEGMCLVFESEYAGRYDYFSACLVNFDTMDEKYAEMMNEDNELAACESHVFSGVLDAFSWLTEKESFQKHTKTVSDWAKFIHKLERYAESLPSSAEYWQADYQQAVLSELLGKEQLIQSLPENQAPETDEPKNYDSGFDCGLLHYTVLDADEGTCQVVGFAEGINGKQITAISFPSRVYEKNALSSTQYKVVGMKSGAFANYSKLRKVRIPYTFDSLPDYAFSGCSTLIDIDIPMSVSSIGVGVFSECSSLEAIPFMLGVSRISESAFSYCTGLTGLNLSVTVDTIGACAFMNCTGLTSLLIPSGVTVIENGAFADSGVTDVVIPATVKIMGSNVFHGCSQLETAYLSEGVEVGDRTFSLCNRMKTATVMNTDTIGKQTFWGNTSLESLILKNAEKRRLSDYFCGEYKDEVYMYPNYEDIDYSGVTTFGGYPKALKSVTVLTGTEIAPHFFQYASLIREFNLPDTINRIGEYAFASCHSIDGLGFLPESVRIIGDSAFQNFEIYDENFGAVGQSLKTIHIPEGIEIIGNCAFYGIETAQELSIPSTVTTIGNSAFAGCGMQSAVVPESVKTVGTYAFAYCKSLEELVIPGSVSDIGRGLVADCPKLERLTIPVQNISNYFSFMFSYVRPDHPSEISDIRVGTNIGDYYVSFIDYSEGSYGTAYTVNQSLKEITVSGGDMIPERAFCGMKSLEKTVIPESVTYIGDDAFYNTDNLKEIRIYNRDCVFSEEGVSICYYASDRGWTTDAVIYGWPGSSAEKFAAENEFEFIPFDPSGQTAEPTEPDTTTPTDSTTGTTTETIVNKAESGDVNGDGEVNLKDVVLIRRYIAGGWNVSLDEIIADVNGDGTVNLKDVVLIRRYIAGGWNVELTSKNA